MPTIDRNTALLEGIREVQAGGLETARVASDAAGRCPLCEIPAPERVQRCSWCRAILTMAQPSALLGNGENVDAALLLGSIQKHERKPRLDARDHWYLALAYLNLGRLAEAVQHLGAVPLLRSEYRLQRLQVHALFTELERRSRPEAAPRAAASAAGAFGNLLNGDN